MTDTHTDGQNNQSLNLLQCSLRSHLEEIKMFLKTKYQKLVTVFIQQRHPFLQPQQDNHGVNKTRI